jgi:hypothetical protein
MDKPSMKMVYGLPRDQTPADAGLIGGNRDGDAATRQQA